MRRALLVLLVAAAGLASPAAAETLSAHLEIDLYDSADHFTFRIRNDSTSASVTKAVITGPDKRTFDAFLPGATYTVSPSQAATNNDDRVQTVTLTFSGTGLAAGASDQNGTGSDLDWRQRASFTVAVTFSNGQTLSGAMTNIGDGDDDNNFLYAADIGFVITPPPDTTTPVTAMTAPASGATVSGTVTVSADASDNVGVAGVQFLLDGSPLGAEDSSAPYAISWDSLSAANGSHSLSAMARDAAGNTATAAAITVSVSNGQSDTTPPSVPTGLSARAVSSTSIELSWNASTDDVGVAGYTVLRDGVEIARTTLTSHSDTGLSPSTTYSYTVAAYDAAENTSAPSSSASATTQAQPVIGWFVSPSGSSSGDGSADNPWDLRTALSTAGGRIGPGDTVWLRGGTYATGSSSFTSSLLGASGQPIVVRQFPGERATIDAAGVSGDSSGLVVDGAWVQFWDFELMSSGLSRTTRRPVSVYVRNTSHVKLVNLVIHELAHVYTEPAAADVEITGLIIYNNGSDDTTRSLGHALYLKNCTGTTHVIRDNVMFNQFGFGVHLYTNAGSGCMEDYTFTGNVAFNNGVPSVYGKTNFLLGGEEPIDRVVARENYVFFSPGVSGSNFRLGYSSIINTNATFERNVAWGGRPLETRHWSNLTLADNVFATTGTVLDFIETRGDGYTWDRNTHYRDETAQAWSAGGTTYDWASWRAQTELGATDTVTAALPTLPSIFVRPNPLQAGRGHVVVYNWPLGGSVQADLSSIVGVGQQFTVHSVQELWGAPLVSGTYAGGTVSLPMTASPPPMIGESPRPLIKTTPDFDVFLVRTQ